MNPPTHAIATGSGIPIIFIHAYPLNARMWTPQVEALSDLASVVVYDLPGFGREPLYDGEQSITALADNCIALLDRFRHDRGILCGCSLGGYIALSALGRDPDRIAGAVLVDTRAGADTPEGAQMRRNQAADAREHGTGSIIKTMLQKLPAPGRASRDAALAGLLRSMMEEANPEGVARMLESMADRKDSFDALRSTKIPVCVLAGELDQLIPPSESEMMAGLAADSELHVIPGCGHLPNLEAPGAFNDIVRKFIKRCGSIPS